MCRDNSSGLEQWVKSPVSIALQLGLGTHSEDMEIRSFASEQTRRLLERLAFQVKSTTRSPAAEAVHELRVAIRRCAQALTVFKARFPRREVKRIRKELKRILTAAGAVRDFDVLAKVLSRIDSPAAVALAQQSRTDRKSQEKVLIALLKRWSARRTISKLCNRLDLNVPNPRTGTVESSARRTLRALGKEFFKSGEPAAAGSSAEELHDFRLVAKKLRYSMELFAPVYRSSLREQIEQIKEIQSLLGAINDYHTVIAMVSKIREQSKLEAELERSARRRIRKFQKIWAERFSGAKQEKHWMEVVDAAGQATRKPVASAKRVRVLGDLAMKA